MTDRKEGRWSYYTLVPDAFGEAQAVVRALVGEAFATEQPAGRTRHGVAGLDVCGDHALLRSRLTDRA